MACAAGSLVSSPTASVAKIHLEAGGSLFVRYYVLVGDGRRRLRMATREVPCGGGDLVWGEHMLRALGWWWQAHRGAVAQHPRSCWVHARGNCVSSCLEDAAIWAGGATRGRRTE